jgi:hypothetical protein
MCKTTGTVARMRQDSCASDGTIKVVTIYASVVMNWEE